MHVDLAKEDDDAYFKFEPGQGIHDIHMKHGKSGG